MQAAFFGSWRETWALLVPVSSSLAFEDNTVGSLGYVHTQSPDTVSE